MSMATLVDPAERVVGLWEGNGRSGVDRQESPGSMWWVEMLAHDVTGATHFYTTLFGWKVRETRLPHLKQADLDRIIDQVEGLGGRGDLPVLDIPNVGRCASLLDDSQCLLCAMQPTRRSG